MSDEITLEQIEIVPCPTCAATPGEKCKLVNGEARMDRIITAAERLKIYSLVNPYRKLIWLYLPSVQKSA
jgi:hypothetical protein